MPTHAFPGLSLLGPKRIRGLVSILRYINPTIKKQQLPFSAHEMKLRKELPLSGGRGLGGG